MTDWRERDYEFWVGFVREKREREEVEQSNGSGSEAS